MITGGWEGTWGGQVEAEFDQCVLYACTEGSHSWCLKASFAKKHWLPAHKLTESRTEGRQS
jgi:hypothetical protein